MEAEESLSLYLQIPHIAIEKLCDTDKYDYYKVHLLKVAAEKNEAVERATNEINKTNETNETNGHDGHVLSRGNWRDSSLDEFPNEEENKSTNHQDGKLNKLNKMHSAKHNKTENEESSQFNRKIEKVGQKVNPVYQTLLKNTERDTSDIKNGRKWDGGKADDFGKMYNEIIKRIEEKKKEEKEKDTTTDTYFVEEASNIHLKKEWLDQWLHFTPLKQFPVAYVNIPEFVKKCENVRKRLKVMPFQMNVKVEKKAEKEKEKEKEKNVNEINIKQNAGTEEEEEKEKEKEKNVNEINIKQKAGTEEEEEEKEKNEYEYEINVEKENTIKKRMDTMGKSSGETGPLSSTSASPAPSRSFLPSSSFLSNVTSEKAYIKRNFYEYFIKILMSGIRAPSVDEIIYNIIYYNCYDWQNKIDTNVLQRFANLAADRCITRPKCNVNWVPETENNEYNKLQIISKLRKKTMSKTFKLVCDFNNSKLKCMFINQNLINAFVSEQKYQAYKTSTTDESSDFLCVISVSFYQPIRGIKVAEFDILSTQTLADLTDSFLCTDCMNYGMPRFEGSVYFIDGILYPDLRKEGVLDYSQNIINFYKSIKNKKPVLKYPYKIQQDKALLKSINIPLFKKCCFLHQGSCEHRIMFTNVRQYNSFRDQELSKYPLRTFKPNVIHRVCQCCHVNTAKKLVVDCYLLKENPSYLCDCCFKLFLLDENDEPVDRTMKFFEYVDDV